MVVILNVRGTVTVLAVEGLATRLLGEQSATEVKVLDDVSQHSRKVGVLTE